jgi:hypothetical protein
MSAKEWPSLGQLDFHNAPKIADSKGSLQQDKTLATMMENEKRGRYRERNYLSDTAHVK